jgi:uncharacterized protein (TIGR03437 family)
MILSQSAARVAKISIAIVAFGTLPAFADCVSFPPNLIPFTSISYVTASNSSGDQLVVGTVAGGANTISQLPLPSLTNQTFCGNLELAPGQFYANTYVPTTDERGGNFSAFNGLLIDPVNSQPFTGGVIPAARLNSIFAFRIGPANIQQTVKEWGRTSSNTYGGSRGALVLLPSGKVFVMSNGPQAEIYDAATGLFTRTANTVFFHGNSPTATLLNDGRVLIVGGTSSPSSAEYYDPASGKFTAITAQTTDPRGVFHTADLLPDGRVLLVGGLNGLENGAATKPNSGAEVFDPKTQTFTKLTAAVNRLRHTTTALADGRVLVIGGSTGVQNIGIIEAFDPKTGKFSTLGSTLLDRVSSSSILLPNGNVLIVGGYEQAGTAEIFDPQKGQSLGTGGMARPREEFPIVALPSGQILVSGGGSLPDFTSATAGAELYNPASGTFTPAADMTTPRFQHEAITLLDGRVLTMDGIISFIPGGLNSAEVYTPVVKGLVASQTGVTFRAAQGAATIAPQTVAILSPTDDIPFSVSVKTFSGGSWLKASAASATVTAAGGPVNLTITVDPTGLAAQDYYGSVTLAPTDQKHAPVSIAVVFNIVPAGAAAPLQVAPSGLVFTGTAGSSPAPQSFVITNFTSRAVNYSATSSGTWFTFAPLSGTITQSLPGKITVTPATGGLPAGVYRGSIKFSFSDLSTQTVDLLLVLSAAPSLSYPADRGATSTCAATKLLPVLTSIASGSVSPVAWPSLVSVQVVDDCGNPISTGSVAANFTNGDSPIALVSIGNGVWQGTWVPQRTSANAAVRVDARMPPSLSGTVQQTVQVAANPKVPVVAAGGILSSGDYSSPPAAGLLVSIFGSALADGSLGFSSAPLPTQLGSTQVLLGGNPLPLLYVSENQVNVLVPYESALNIALPLIVVRANATSVSVQTAVFGAQPAILSTAGNGIGQGHIYRAFSSGATLADSKSPATAGDVLVIYAVGLGAVTPPVITGTPAPSSPLAQVAAPVNVTIGEQTVQPSFAGLSPGYVGLYQLNLTMPSGVTPGNQVPVIVSVGGKSSSGAITMAVK